MIITRVILITKNVRFYLYMFLSFYRRRLKCTKFITAFTGLNIYR